MSIGEVQTRINQIQSMMLAAVSAPATTAATSATTGTTGASGTRFAAALEAAVAAERSGSVTGTGTTGTVTGTTGTPSTTGTDTWVKPTQGRVTSGFGPRWGAQHEGMDIAAATGTPVRAATGGVVKKASWYGGYGNAVIVDHGGGVRTLYGHNSKLLVRPGDRVQPGQVIAQVGSTGDSTGPHLHFEVEVNGDKVNPRPWLKRHGVTF